MLEINNVHASIGDKEILKGLNLRVKAGEIHALMGPNGAGKSTLAKILAGDPAYEISAGEILFEGQSILELSPEERAHLGLFISFQYPLEIAGISNVQFLQTAHRSLAKAKGEIPLDDEAFTQLLNEKMKLVEMRDEFKERNVNEGFSGGEKKRNEILQMALLEPKLAVLDETDSGLDIDALRIVAQGVNRLHRPDKGLILITHYQRLLDYICPHFIHVMVEGQIVLTGTAELARQLEEKGYDWLAALAKE